jgi:hypothetical protein
VRYLDFLRATRWDGSLLVDVEGRIELQGSDFKVDIAKQISINAKTFYLAILVGIFRSGTIILRVVVYGNIALSLVCRCGAA